MAYLLDKPTLDRLDRSLPRVERGIYNPTRPPGSEFARFDSGWRPFKNVSGATMPGYSTAKPDTSHTINLEETILHLEKHETAFHPEHWITWADDTPNNGYGMCIQSAPTVDVKFDTGTPAFGEMWGAKPGEWVVSLGYPGLYVLGVIDATNKILRAIPRLPVLSVIGKAGLGITKGSTGSVTIWKGISGSEGTSTFTITARALWAAITASKYVLVTWLNGVPYVSPLECS